MKHDEIYTCKAHNLMSFNTCVHDENVTTIKIIHIGNSLAIQWLQLCPLTAEGLSSVPDQDTKIPRAGWHSQKKKKKIIHTSFISQSFLLLFCNQSLPVLTLCSQDTLFFFKAIKIMFAFSKILYKWNHIVFFV